MKMTTKPEKAGFSVERLNRITNQMEHYVDQGELAGVMTLVERKGEIVHLTKCGYQDLLPKNPSSSTRFSGYIQ